MNNELKELLDLRNDVDFQNDFQNYVYCYSGNEIKVLLDYISTLEDKINTSVLRNEKISSILLNKEKSEMTKSEIKQLIDLLSKEEFIYALAIAKGYEKLENRLQDAIRYVKSITWSDGCIDCEPYHTRQLLQILNGRKESENVENI